MLKLKAANSEERDNWVQIIKGILKKEQKILAEVAAQPGLNSLFEDCEPNWTPNQRDVAILLKLENQEISIKKTSLEEPINKEKREERQCLK